MKQIIALLLGIALLVIGTLFSLILLPIVAGAAILAFGYFWWHTRHLRKAMRNQPSPAPGANTERGQVIDGESVRVHEDSSLLH